MEQQKLGCLTLRMRLLVQELQLTLVLIGLIKVIVKRTLLTRVALGTQVLLVRFTTMSSICRIVLDKVDVQQINPLVMVEMKVLVMPKMTPMAVTVRGEERQIVVFTMIIMVLVQHNLVVVGQEAE